MIAVGAAKALAIAWGFALLGLLVLGLLWIREAPPPEEDEDTHDHVQDFHDFQEPPRSNGGHRRA